MFQAVSSAITAKRFHFDPILRKFGLTDAALALRAADSRVVRTAQAEFIACDPLSAACKKRGAP